MTDSLDAWIRVLAEGLEVSSDAVDRDLLLGLAKEAAHRVDRPAAPLTTYLVGLAAGRDGGGSAALARAASTAAHLVGQWSTDNEPRSH